ncbi:MAG: hypothetical protein R2939_09120 [Kofleriaceae bacterium]
MSAARWRGLAHLIRDATVHGLHALERTQRAMVARPLAIASAVAPALAPVADAATRIHGAVLAGVHGAVRAGARAAAVVADALIERGEDAR